MSEADLNVLRGSLELLILKALSGGPRHGYAVAEWIEGATDDTLLVEEGTLYPALHRLEKKGAVRSEWGVSGNTRQARFYSLTTAGRTRFRRDVSLWQRYAAAIEKALSSPVPAGT